MCDIILNYVSDAIFPIMLTHMLWVGMYSNWRLCIPGMQLQGLYIFDDFE